MRIKSYYAASVEAAVQLAREEIGADAMLLNSRRADPEARHLGEYEVVFAMAPDQPRPDLSAEVWRRQISRELHDLRRDFERNLSNLQQCMQSQPSAELVLDARYRRLVQIGIQPKFAGQILQSASAESDIADVVARWLPADPDLSGVVVLVGPAGAGKTTTIAKLAVCAGLLERRSTQLMTLDVERVGGAAHLQALGAAIGAGCQTVDSESGLAMALDEYRSKRLILVDTPGYDVHTIGNAQTLARYLRQRTDVQVHLVLEASRREADLLRIIDRFSVFTIDRLIVTKLDETESRGMLLNLAAHARKPISCVTGGQRIPEDLDRTSSNRLAAWMLQLPAAGAVAVAA